MRRALKSFRRATSLPAAGAAAPAVIPGVGWSDHWSFWQFGYPALMLTDTAPFRYPYYHTAQDTPDKLDYDRLTRAVTGIAAIIRDLASR
ncbi:MAG: M28 family peptidase [Acidobacteriaceae bacterium]|nr:M28 family peptidase [Acidobacteriaceae bacterium]MBV9780548.1 M28 family peptidase [Acidobacteriaceae bacterium]